MSTACASAQSATVRAIGPTVSKLAREREDALASAPRRAPVFSPTTPQHAAGIRTEPPVSVPSASGTIPAASAAALPLLEPPATRSGAVGLTVSP